MIFPPATRQIWRLQLGIAYLLGMATGVALLLLIVAVSS